MSPEHLRKKLFELDMENRSIRTEFQQNVYIITENLIDPAATIQKNLKLLEEKCAPCLGPEDMYLLKSLEGHSVRLHEMLDALGDYIKISTRGTPYEIVDSRELIEAARQSPRVEEMLLVLPPASFVVQGDLPMIKVDRKQIQFVFTELIVNALKFCEENPIKISVSFSSNDNKFVFSVEDFGGKLKEEQKDSVFRLFQKQPGHESVPGLGMGLAFCKRIVDRHGGKIWAEVEPNKKTSFRFTLGTLCYV